MINVHISVHVTVRLIQ